MEEALRLADWNGFERRRAEAKARGKLRGIGCAVFIEPSGGAGQEEIAIRFDADGRPQLFTLAGPSGQGHETVFPDLVGRHSRHVGRTRSRCGRAIPTGRRSSAPARSARAR